MAKTRTREKESDRERPERPERPRPHSDAYVVMLVVTLLAIAVGSVLMYLDHQDYGGKAPPKEAVPALPKLGDGDAKAPGS
jgi:hypothetical protein